MEKFNPKLLAAARKKKKLTWLQVAKLLGLTKVCYWKYEHGQVMPPLPKLCQLAALYGCSVADFLDSTENTIYPKFDAAKIKSSRVGAGKTISDVAKRAGIPATIITAIEAGNIAISPQLALKLAKMYHVDVTSMYAENQ